MAGEEEAGTLDLLLVTPVSGAELLIQVEFGALALVLGAISGRRTMAIARAAVGVVAAYVLSAAGAYVLSAAGQSVTRRTSYVGATTAVVQQFEHPADSAPPGS